MKIYILKFLCLIGMVLFFQSCDSELEESPKTFISPETFFKNPASYDLAVVGIYSGIGNLYSNNAMTMREMFSDVYGAPSGAAEQAMPTYNNTHQPFFYNTRDLWSGAYSIIKNANFILDKLSVADLPEQKVNELMAEAKFLRAFSYFHLVQFYGDIPLRTTTLSSYDEIKLGKSSQEDVYRFILEELSFAEKNLPDSSTQQGRVFKLVATALISKVYLTMAGYPLNQAEHYKDAKEKAIVVIDSKQFQLLNNYSDVFHNIDYSSESIWEKLYVADKGGNPLHSATSTAKGYNYLMVPAPWFINSFAPGDQRNEWGINQNYMDPDGDVLQPFFQKFVNNDFTDANIGASSSSQLNYTTPILRLAEMYLIAAEAENELNGPAGAYQYINKIRERARVDKTDPLNVPDLAGLTKDQFREQVLMERKWELHLEGSTWMDLKRTKNLNRIQTSRETNPLLIPIGEYNNTWYIPDTEITNNDIPQNPSYN